MIRIDLPLKQICPFNSSSIKLITNNIVIHLEVGIFNEKDIMK